MDNKQGNVSALMGEGKKNRWDVPPAIAEMLRTAYFSGNMPQVTLLKGGKNNRVCKLSNRDKIYVLKVYAPPGLKNRNRLKSEYEFLLLARNGGVKNVPEPVYYNGENNLALYSYIQGHKPAKKDADGKGVRAAIQFVKKLNTPEIREAAVLSKMGQASEACPTLNDHFEAVDCRIERLNAFQARDRLDEEARSFIRSLIVPEWEKTKQKLNRLRLDDTLRSRDQQIISPSDFGFHNAIIDDHGVCNFIDFEYAGWDCPVKMICDFFCQPRIPIAQKYFEHFANQVRRLSSADLDIKRMAAKMMPVYRIKWCCIILNDFLPGDRERRAFALSNRDLRKVQLKMASEYAKTYVM